MISAHSMILQLSRCPYKPQTFLSPAGSQLQRDRVARMGTPPYPWMYPRSRVSVRSAATAAFLPAIPPCHSAAGVTRGSLGAQGGTIALKIPAGLCGRRFPRRFSAAAPAPRREPP